MQSDEVQQREGGGALHEERDAARSEVLGMWGSGTLSVDMSNKDGMPSQQKSAAGEKSGV